MAKAKCAKAKCGSCSVEQPASHVASAEQPARSTSEQLSKKLKREHAIAESKFAESKWLNLNLLKLNLLKLICLKLNVSNLLVRVALG